MSNFCDSCGAATGAGRFCRRCGAPIASAGQTATSAPTRNKAPQTVKVVFIILGAMIVLGLGGTVATYYVVKNKFEQIAQANGGTNLSDAISDAGRAQQTHAGCEILSKEKVAEILGSAVARAEGNEAGDIKEYCNYWSKPSDGPAAGKDNSDAASNDRPATLKDLQDLAKSISASAKGNGPLLVVQIFRGTAKVALVSLKTASVLTGQKQEKVEGPWDEAYFGPFDAVLFVRKGDSGVMLDMHQAPQPREKSLALAKVMMPGI